MADPKPVRTLTIKACNAEYQYRSSGDTYIFLECERSSLIPDVKWRAIGSLEMIYSGASPYLRHIGSIMAMLLSSTCDALLDRGVTELVVPLAESAGEEDLDGMQMGPGNPLSALVQAMQRRRQG